MKEADHTLLVLCEPLGEFVCTHKLCSTIVPAETIVAHLRRKHKFPAAEAQKEADHLYDVRDLTKRVSYWKKYFDNPYPGENGLALPQLPILKVGTIVKCPICVQYFGNLASCRAHVNASHAGDSKKIAARKSLLSSVLVPGQTLFSGSKTKYFPIIIEPKCAAGLKSISKSILAVEGEKAVEGHGKELVARKDRSMNAAAAILDIPAFMDANNVTCQRAYDLTTFDATTTFSATLRLITGYMNFFCQRKEAIPQHLVDMVRLRNIGSDCHFSLQIQPRTRERYARSITRLIMSASNLHQYGTQPRSDANHLKQAADVILRNAIFAGNEFDKMLTLHKFLSALLLVEVEASKGERILLEDVFKLVLAGYSCSNGNAGARVGYADDASHLCAALQFVCQVVALGEFMVPPSGFGPPNIAGSTSEVERREHLKALLSTESCTPAAFIRSTLRKTKRLSHGDTPRVTFAPCFAHPFCGKIDNIEIQMNSRAEGSLGFAIRSIQADTRLLLEEKLLRRFKVPESTWDTALSFADSISSKEVGYFFGSHKHSKPTMDGWAESFASYLTEGNNPLVVSRCTTAGRGWQHSADSTAWLKDCDKLVRLLYLLIHVCGGGPPRVTEMINAKLKNTATGRRNVFLYKGYVAILVSYTKTQSQFERPKPIARFLDRQTTRILLSYIIFVKPIQKFLMRSCFGQEGGADEFLFTRHGDVLKESTIYPFFQSTMKSKGVPFSVLQFRHFRTGIVKTFMGEYGTVTGESACTLQSGHSEETAKSCYAGVELDFTEFTTAVAESYLAVSLKWHVLAGLSVEISVSEDNVSKDIKRAPSHNSGENKIDGREDRRSEPLCLSNQSEEQFGSHVGVKERNAPAKRKRHEELRHYADAVHDGQNLKRARKYVVEDPSDSLRRFIGTNMSSVTFKSLEQEAGTLECLIQTFSKGFRSSLILILPTGGGKTVCWAAPALGEQSQCLKKGQDMRISVIVIPLISLQQDQLGRLRDCGLSAVQWRQRNEPGVSTVICSIEIVGTSEYEQFLTQKAKHGLLARIVLDESHLLPLWYHFRDFSKLKHGLRPSEVDVPLVLLSATIPPKLLNPIQEIAGVDNRCLKIIRAKVGRHNIKYTVIRTEKKGSELLQYTAERLFLELNVLRPYERIIAFCLTIDDAKLLWRRLSKSMSKHTVHLYHGSMYPEEREKSFGSWCSSTSTPQIMVATSAFSCGIDYSAVRCVLHVGGCRSLVELAQETGRAGRDGRPSKSIVLYSPGHLLRVTKFQSVSNSTDRSVCDGRKRVSSDPFCTATWKEMFGDFRSFAERSEGCRRALLETFLDGIKRESCENLEERCDMCKPCRTVLEGEVLDETTFNRLLPQLQHEGTADQQHEAKESSATLPQLKPMVLPIIVTQDYIESQEWKAKELSLLKCPVCVVQGQYRLPNASHRDCLRARCYRCMEYPSIHQSSNCAIVPRSKNLEERCYFCGIPKLKRCHSEGSYNKRNCPWLIVKNICLLLWRDGIHQKTLLESIPALLPCVSANDVCLTLCGGMRDCEKPMIFAAVDLLHQRYVNERGSFQSLMKSSAI